VVLQGAAASATSWEGIGRGCGDGVRRSAWQRASDAEAVSKGPRLSEPQHVGLKRGSGAFLALADGAAAARRAAVRREVVVVGSRLGLEARRYLYLVFNIRGHFHEAPRNQPPDRMTRFDPLPICASWPGCRMSEMRREEERDPRTRE